MVARSSRVLVVISHLEWQNTFRNRKVLQDWTKRKTKFSHTLAAPAKDVPENKKTEAIKPKIQLTAEVLVKIACACSPKAPEVQVGELFVFGGQGQPRQHSKTLSQNPRKTWCKPSWSRKID